jgi:hypothetical protein
MEMADILVRIIYVTKDPLIKLKIRLLGFTLKDVGIEELQIRDRTEPNLVEIVRVSY